MSVEYVRVGTGVARVAHLVCSECGSAWQREGGMGRDPKRCPDCRRAKIQRKVTSPVVYESEPSPYILGPVPCQGCREAVSWNGWTWESASGDRHSCDNAQVGISDASPDIMCDALLVADTSREGVPRLEVSAP